MNKVVVSLMIGLVGVVLAAAADKPIEPARKAYNDALVLFNQGDYVAAQSALEKAIRDNPSASIGDRVLAQMQLGHSLRKQGKSSEAQAAYAKAATLYPAGVHSGASDSANADALRWAAWCMKIQGNKSDAEAGYKRVLAECQLADARILVDAQSKLADVLKSEGKSAESQAAYRAAVLNYIRSVGAPDENSRVWSAFVQVDMAASDYTAFVESVKKITPAIPENAAFLGRLKDELGK